MNLGNFLTELKRRHVYRIAVGYAVVAWLLIQVATQVFPFFEVPNGAVRLVVVLLALGFPVALILSWAFELTPEGIKRTKDVTANDSGSTFRAGRKFVGIVLAMAVLATGLMAYHLTREVFTGSVESRLTRATPAQKSIAVLPLLNESGDPTDEYFSDGLSEELIAALGQIKELKVVGRSSSFRFKAEKVDNKAIAEKLGVNTLLEGTVRKQGNEVRIVAELINAADGTELWTQTFERELKDIFAVQREIAVAVASSLELTLLGDDEDNKVARKAMTSSVEAHNAYLQGHFYFQRRNLEDYQRAVGFFDQAVKADPDYALAYAERSEAWTWISDLTSENQRPAWNAAAEDAEKAVAIDPNLAEAQAALGWVRVFIQWRFEEGLKALRRAKQLSPWNATANDLLARVVVYFGQFDEAEQFARQALEIDPFSYQAHISLGRVLFFKGKLDEAAAVGRKAAELQPNGAASHRWQVLVAAARGDGEAALREAQLEPNEQYRRFELAIAYHVRREPAKADAVLAELINKDRSVLAYQIAEVYAWRGEADKTFEWLQISFDSHDTGLLSVNVEPVMRPLQSDPRFAALVRKIGLPAKL
jgi:serine/threonine-protein kinase